MIYVQVGADKVFEDLAGGLRLEPIVGGAVKADVAK
jgi:hypothetical protein